MIRYLKLNQTTNINTNTDHRDNNMSSLLIVNAQLVNEGSTVEGGVYVENGRISQIGRGIMKKECFELWSFGPSWDSCL